MQILSHPTAISDPGIMSLDHNEKASSVDPSIVKAFMALDKKLDYIIHLIQSEEGEKQVMERVGICLDISGIGLKMATIENPVEHQKIKIDIRPPTFPPLIITAIGIVTRIGESNIRREGDAEFAVEFSAINAEDREQLIKYIFKRQREILRNQE